MLTPILQVCAAVFGVIASMWISKIVNGYWQAYQNSQNKKSASQDKSDAQDDLKHLDDQHKSLKDIEGR
jgi:hypothetical protein